MTTEPTNLSFLPPNRTSYFIFLSVLFVGLNHFVQMPFVCFERLLSAAQASSSAVSSDVAEGDEHFVCSDFLHPSTDRPYLDALINFLEKVVGR